MRVPRLFNHVPCPFKRQVSLGLSSLQCDSLLIFIYSWHKKDVLANLSWERQKWTRGAAGRDFALGRPGVGGSCLTSAGKEVS